MWGAKGYRYSHRRRKAAACCLILNVIIVIVLLVLYFTLFRPKDPSFKVQSITVQSLNIGSFSDHNTDWANVTLLLCILVKNPNRATFHFTDSKAYMYYYGLEIGSASIPAGNLGSKSSSYLNVPLTVESPSSFAGPYLKGDVGVGLISLAVAMKLSGHVTVIHIFSNHASRTARCYVIVSSRTNNVMDYGCKYDVSI